MNVFRALAHSKLSLCLSVLLNYIHIPPTWAPAFLCSSLEEERREALGFLTSTFFLYPNPKFSASVCIAKSFPAFILTSEYYHETPSIYLSIYPSIYLSIYLSIYPSIYLSIYLYIS